MVDAFKNSTRHLPGGVHLLCLDYLQKQRHSSERKMQSMHEGICQLRKVLIGLFLFLVTSGATNDCVSISVKIVKLPIKNKVSD